ncbi:protein-tyrosine phosphatase [Actinidia rufa]|uniref:Protein-tyrosine phosphatase n=1 Tax=Actinidia rufa TaxID=165716 RepID=A0A7J0H456_9ERIC|nr:protein-tyrosine phosphatase [Actinidia rufa]
MAVSHFCVYILRCEGLAAQESENSLGRCRPMWPSDFRDFDLILTMDKQNRGGGRDSADILGALERRNFRENLPADAHKKVIVRSTMKVKFLTLTMADHKALRRFSIYLKMPVNHFWTAFYWKRVAFKILNVSVEAN